MAFVGETVGLVALRDCLHVRLLPALSLVGIQDLNIDRKKEHRVRKPALEEALLRLSGNVYSQNNKYVNLEKNPTQEGASYLEYPWNLFCLSSVHISLCYWSDVKQFAAQDVTKFVITFQKTSALLTCKQHATCNMTSVVTPFLAYFIFSAKYLTDYKKKGKKYLLYI